MNLIKGRYFRSGCRATGKKLTEIMDDLKAAKETNVTGTPREGTRHTAGNQQ
jgi:hypothetical protein